MTTTRILEMFTNILLLNKKNLCYNYYDSEMIKMDFEEEKFDEDFISLDALNDQEIIEQYQETDAFLKLVEEEIKKTDVGDSVE